MRTRRLCVPADSQADGNNSLGGLDEVQPTVLALPPSPSAGNSASFCSSAANAAAMAGAFLVKRKP